MSSDLLYLDAARSVDDRLRDLLRRMTLAEKAGLAFHTMALAGPRGTITGDAPFLALPGTESLILDSHVNHFNLVGGGTARDLATWHNALQDLAKATRLKIPITLSTDPRHAFHDNLGTGAAAGSFTAWPEPIGFAAIGDPALVERFGSIAAQEYRAVGISVALHPQADLATEPRWARVAGTFGEQVDLVCDLTEAYVRGFHGPRFGPASVSTMTKHFPGGGPQRDGEDPHFSYGREQDYPGGRFREHLAPFVAAIRAGTRQIMPSYGLPTLDELAGVAFCFDRGVITDLLRGELGFDGIVCTDWGVITDVTLLGQEMPARAWGLEHVDPAERLALAFDAGVDQIGGEHCVDLLVDLVNAGRLSEERLDASVVRILREKLELGLFESRQVDVDEAERVVGHTTWRVEGRDAQRSALTVLTGGDRLPLSPADRVHLVGFGTTTAPVGPTATGPDETDITIVRLAAPFEPRPGGFEAMFHAGSLAYQPDALTDLLATLDTGPSIVVVDLDRPAVLTPIVEAAGAVVAAFGAEDQAIIDGLYGRGPMSGHLPFDLPSSSDAVAAGRCDTAFDTPDPLFTFGHSDAPDPPGREGRGRYPRRVEVTDNG